MAIEKLYRPATVSKSEAVKALFAARPDADLVSFKRVARKGNEIVEDENGTLFEAVLKVAGDFPPKKEDSGSESDDSSADDSAPEPSDSESSDDSKSDDSSDTAAPDFGGGDEGGDAPKKLSPEEETNSLLRQILHAIQGGGLGDDLAGPDDLADPTALPDVGAPPAGGSLPHDKSPLPPPVPNPKDGPAGMGGAFAHVAGLKEAVAKESFEVERKGGASMDDAALLREARQMAPTHKVTKIVRDTFSGLATLTLVKR